MMISTQIHLMEMTRYVVRGETIVKVCFYICYKDCQLSFDFTNLVKYIYHNNLSGTDGKYAYEACCQCGGGEK